MANLNYKNLTLEHMKEFKRLYMESLENVNVNKFVEAADDSDTVTLYHGTTTVHLNSILTNGIMPRGKTGIDNWSHAGSSVQNIVYMTNKWHYFYAVNATMEFLEIVDADLSMYEQIEKYNAFPCYVECKVPKALLVFDEDAIVSKFMLQKAQKSLKEGGKLVYDPMECLAQYGTVGVVGGIPTKYIKSFTVLGELEMYQFVIEKNSQYRKDWEKWQKGNGKGKMKLKDLLLRETKSDLNGSWWVHCIPKGGFIERFGVNPKTKKLAMKLGKL